MIDDTLEYNQLKGLVDDLIDYDMDLANYLNMKIEETVDTPYLETIYTSLNGWGADRDRFKTELLERFPETDWGWLVSLFKNN